ncbi:hypothetical protein Tsubulata_043519 [Turnera subulata]|uniref:MYB-CC type transcription factor LHEQLE-containing domain-containing protein n=1 Tax=Turnera subulata TaxID=218843 RepID=A0A9Q0J876_9ROSI|nr:hypothetical protein Tsubulata_043519 [Turnera subulata]
MGVHSQNMNLVLSTDAKPRLKWTQELHQRFTEAVNQLGGPEKATPKSLMRKYRLGKSQQSHSGNDNKQEDYKEIQSSDDGSSMVIGEASHNSINESLQISQALQMQMEVQRKLHEQIEVQRHLQLRIEAQGKYLQTVLKKAQETLSGYNSSTVGIELAKAELSRLASMVNAGYPSSSISELTETGPSSLQATEEGPKRMRSTVCSMESSLTSSESSGRKDDHMLQNNEHGNASKPNIASIELPLMDVHPQDRLWNGSDSSNEGKKRNAGIITCDGISIEQPLPKRWKCGDQLRKSRLSGTFDLNTLYQNDIELAPNALDLNCNGIEQLSGHL